MDREGYRATTQRGIHLAEPIQGLGGAPEGWTVIKEESITGSATVSLNLAILTEHFVLRLGRGDKGKG